MPVRVAQDVSKLVLGTGVLCLGAILRYVQPALDQLLVSFQMELQAVGAIAEAESLVRAGRRAGQVHSAGRKFEGVRMPLEHVLIAIEMAAKRVATGR